MASVLIKRENKQKYKEDYAIMEAETAVIQPLAIIRSLGKDMK